MLHIYQHKNKSTKFWVKLSTPFCLKSVKCAVIRFCVLPRLPEFTAEDTAEYESASKGVMRVTSCC